MSQLMASVRRRSARGNGGAAAADSGASPDAAREANGDDGGGRAHAPLPLPLPSSDASPGRVVTSAFASVPSAAVLASASSPTASSPLGGGNSSSRAGNTIATTTGGGGGRDASLYLESELEKALWHWRASRVDIFSAWTVLAAYLLSGFLIFAVSVARHEQREREFHYEI